MGSPDLVPLLGFDLGAVSTFVVVTADLSVATSGFGSISVGGLGCFVMVLCGTVVEAWEIL